MRLANKHGFTLTELIVVIVVLGILAFVALPRFAGNQDFVAKGYTDQVISSLRYAQKTAVAQRRRVQVNVAPAGSISLNLCTVAAGGDTCSAAMTGCGTAIGFPSGAASVPVPSGFALAANSFRFDCMGRPVTDANTAWVNMATQDMAITATGVNRTVRVENETGYVHEI